MKVYLAILLFFVAALMFAQLNSNICLGCQNDSSQIINNTQANPNQNRFQLISKRFLGQGSNTYSNSDSYNNESYNSGAPTRLNRSTGNTRNTGNVASPRSLTIEPAPQTGTQVGIQRSLGNSVSTNFNRIVNRLPLRNLGGNAYESSTELNRNTTSIQEATNQQTATNSQQPSQGLLRNLGFSRNSFSRNNDGAQNLRTTNPTTSNPATNSAAQLRNLGRGQANATAPLKPEQTQSATQQLRLLPGTFDNVPRVLNEIPTLSATNSESSEPLAKEASDAIEGAVHNFSNSELQIPLMVPEVSVTTETKTTEITTSETKTTETTTPENPELSVEVEAPKLLDALPTAKLPEIEVAEVEASKEAPSIIDRVLTTFGASNAASTDKGDSNKSDASNNVNQPIKALQTSTAPEEEEAGEVPDTAVSVESEVVESSENTTTTENTVAVQPEESAPETSVVDAPESTSQTIEEMPSTTAVLAAPLETATEETSTTIETSTIETTETQSTETIESTSTTEETEPEESTSSVSEDLEPIESEETSVEVNEESTTTSVLAPPLSETDITEPVTEPISDAISEEAEDVSTENGSESTSDSGLGNDSDSGTTNILLPSLGGISPKQNITPITPNPDTQPAEAISEETISEEVKPTESPKPEEGTDGATPSKETEPKETEPEEIEPEETGTEEITAPIPEETPEVVIEKIDLEDIAVDSEIDYWNAYFAQNAKSYDDLAAQNKKQNTPLLIVDTMQGESGTACNLENPCSLITALSKLTSGGTVLIREGDYELRQRINITRSGTAASPIVIRNYPEEAVVLSGKRLSGSGADAGLINISDQQHIRIQGLELADYSSSKKFGTVAAIMLRRSASNIEIIQNHIHDIKTLAPKNNTSALGIAIYGTSPTKPMQNILIQGNHVHDLTLGFSESISLSGNVDGFRIEGNQVHDVDNIGIVVAGGYGTACWESANQNRCDNSFDYARNGLVMGNTVYNVDTRKNSAYPDNTVNAAAGIYVDGARTVVVERNRVYSNGSGLSVSSENAGGLAKDIIVRNNLIYNNFRTGINLGAENAQKGRVDNATITNNTFYNNDLSPQWGGEIFMEFDVDNSLIANNIFYADNYIYDAGNDVDLDINLIINDGLPPEVSGSENNKLVSNIYHGKGINRTWQWQGKWYNHESFEAFLEASGDKLDEIEGSFDADPGFAFLPETPDEQVGLIRLEPSLINPPSKNRAFPLSASIVGDLDKAANPRLNDNALDIGAYEH